MSKKIVWLSLLLTITLALSGCSLTGKKEVIQTENVPSVPKGAVMASEGKKIELTDLSLTLPDGMNYGQKETDNGTVYYVWNTEEDYVLPTSLDVIFYIYEGNDKKSPDKVLSDAEARNSISQTYMQTFRTGVEKGHINIDANIVYNNKWYNLCFIGDSGSDNIVTTYGTYCYPKTYYGIYTLQKNVSADYSRNYYGFVFSNNSEGEIMTEGEYTSLFNQIKSGFGIETFFTLPQNPLSYDPAKDTSKGYSYTQLETLFENTKNYYIVKNNKSGASQSVSGNSTEPADLKGLYNVVRIVDGDTIVVDINGTETKVRLIGVDTPESVSSDESENTKEGKKASEWTTNLLTEKQVYLEYDVSTEDKYGRSLAYVYLSDGKTMVNKELIKGGFAQVMTVQPNSKYADEFYDLQVAAREAKVGFWETGFFSE